MPYAVEENLRGMPERNKKRERQKEKIKKRQSLGLFTIRWKGKFVVIFINSCIYLK